LQEFVIERIRDFYSEHFYMDGGRSVYEESSIYKEKVRDLDKNIMIKMTFEVGRH